MSFSSRTKWFERNKARGVKGALCSPKIQPKSIVMAPRKSMVRRPAGTPWVAAALTLYHTLRRRQLLVVRRRHLSTRPVYLSSFLHTKQPPPNYSHAVISTWGIRRRGGLYFFFIFERRHDRRDRPGTQDGAASAGPDNETCACAPA